jgi:hypothetical protein
MAVMLF